MYLLIVGMVSGWFIIYRGLRPRLAVESRGNLPWLFLYSSLSIPAFYAVGLLTHTQSTFAIGDFWRFWGRPSLGRGLPRALHHPCSWP